MNENTQTHKKPRDFALNVDSFRGICRGNAKWWSWTRYQSGDKLRVGRVGIGKYLTRSRNQGMCRRRTDVTNPPNAAVSEFCRRVFNCTSQ